MTKELIIKLMRYVMGKDLEMFCILNGLLQLGELGELI